MIKKFVVWGLGFEVVQVDEKLVGFLFLVYCFWFLQHNVH